MLNRFGHALCPNVMARLQEMSFKNGLNMVRLNSRLNHHACKAFGKLSCNFGFNVAISTFLTNKKIKTNSYSHQMNKFTYFSLQIVYTVWYNLPDISDIQTCCFC